MKMTPSDDPKVKFLDALGCRGGAVKTVAPDDPTV
jgi:hypothetical protein